MKTCPVCDTDYPDQHTNCPTDGAVLIVSHELAEGSLVRGKYRIIRKLGQGGMGVVYLAEDILLGVQVALKFLAGELSKDPKFIKRFRNEARAAYQLRHPNIVEVTSLDQAEDGSLFIAMEYVEGPSLRSYHGDPEFAEFPHSVERALAVARDIASGLAAAHAQGTVHRDIKPENILLTRCADGRERAKILDFGIAAISESVTRLSITHGILLTPEYAAPEQWLEMPAAEMDGRTDSYALGCVLYEMLTRRAPFHAHNTAGWMKQHLDEAPQPPSQLRPDLADWVGLDELVLRLLAKNREDRLRDAELLSLLDAVHYAPREQRQRTVEEEAGKRRETVVEEAKLKSETIVETPQPGPFPEQTHNLEEEQTPDPAEEESLLPIFAKSESGSRVIPNWVWGALAVLVGPAFAAVLIFTAQKQSQPGPSQANQSASQQETDQGHKLNDSQYSNLSAPGSAPAAESRPSAQKPDLDEIEQQANALYDKKSYAEAAPLYDRACVGGSAFSCSRLGYFYNLGQGVEKDDSHAVALYSKACDGRDASGCGNLGDMYRNGQGVGKDDSRAVTFYFKGCELGNDNACGNVGLMFDNGHGIAMDSSRVAALFTKSCDRGDSTSCNSLGRMYQDGTAIAKDISRAVTLYTKACHRGNAQSCDLLGRMYDEGLALKQDYSQAATLYSKACNEGDAEGCSDIGNLYRFGIGVEKDSAKAKELLKRSCDEGSQRGCARLKAMQ